MKIDSSDIHLSAEHSKFEMTHQRVNGQNFMQELISASLLTQRAEMRTSRVGLYDTPLLQPDNGNIGRSGNDGSAALGDTSPELTGKRGSKHQQAFQPQPFQLLPTAFTNRFGLAPFSSAGRFDNLGMEFDRSAGPFNPFGTGSLGLGQINGLSGPATLQAGNSSARFFQALLNALTGRQHQVDHSSTEAAAQHRPVSAAAAAGFAGLGINGLERVVEVDVQVSQYHKETECTNFSACGSVQTSDGRSIALNLNLQMSRSYESQIDFHAKQQVVFKDPLVINFNGTAAELTEDKYEFDLDVDGEMDWISFVGPDSGLLALDKNDDGQINDGSELFGAISGDGFADLAQYDLDGNGFIDENDSIFADLKIWSKQEGEDRLDSLSDKNVGAIYLGSTETPFELKDDANNLHGRVRESGIYLDEDGGVGTVQQIDMVV